MKEQKQPLVSVVIPTKNSSQTIQACLESIKNQTYVPIQLIVVDNNSSDNTKEIVKQYTQLVFNKGPERSAQRNYGAKKSIGGFLVFIDSDMVLSEDVVADCVKEITETPSLKALVIPEESFGDGFWAQCKKLERSFYLGIDWIEAPRFFTKESFEKVKGFDELLCGPEDWDIYQRVSAQYGIKSIGRIESFIYHNEGKLSLYRTLQKKAYYMKKIIPYKNKEVNKKAFVKQGGIAARYFLFLSSPKKLLKNPLIGLGMLFMKTSEFLVAAVCLYLPKEKKI